METLATFGATFGATGSVPIRCWDDVQGMCSTGAATHTSAYVVQYGALVLPILASVGTPEL